MHEIYCGPCGRSFASSIRSEESMAEILRDAGWRISDDPGHVECEPCVGMSGTDAEEVSE